MPLELKQSRGIWQIVGTVSARFGAEVVSKRVRRSARTRSRSEALRIAAALEAEALGELERAWRQARGEDPTTFEEAVIAYLDAGGSPRFLEPLLTYFRGVRVAQIAPADVERAAVALYPRAQISTRRRQAIAPARAVLNHHAGRRPQPRSDQSRTRWLSPREAERLVAAAEPRMRRIILFLLSSGVRTGELIAIESEHVDRTAGQVWIAAERSGARKTGAARWVRPQPPGLAALLEDLPELGAAFRTPKGEPYKLRDHGGGQIKGGFDRARQAAGLGPDVTPHVLRHTWATWTYAVTRDLLRVERLGGWRSPAMVRRYTKLAPEGTAAELIAAGWFDDRDRMAPPSSRADQTSNAV